MSPAKTAVAKAPSSFPTAPAAPKKIGMHTKNTWPTNEKHASNAKGRSDMATKGQFKSIGWHRYGSHWAGNYWEFFECVDCGIRYHAENGSIRCNGREIAHCLCALIDPLSDEIASEILKEVQNDGPVPDIIMG